MDDRQRLEAIVSVINKYLPPNGIPINDAMSEIISLVDPLPAPQPAQEPVAWMSEEDNCIFFGADKPNPMDYDFWTPLYTTPPQRPWVGLTDEEVYMNCPNWLSQEQCKDWIQQIEAKLKERNYGT